MDTWNQKASNRYNLFNLFNFESTYPRPGLSSPIQTQTNTMKLAILTLLFGSAAIVTATPIEVADLSVQTLAEANGTDITGRAASVGCIIRTWSGTKCTGTNWATYEYVPSNECRACRSNGGNSHSFSLEANCPYGKLWASAGGNCDGDNGVINMRGVGCYNVNTGYRWSSFRPCFGQ